MSHDDVSLDPFLGPAALDLTRQLIFSEADSLVRVIETLDVREEIAPRTVSLEFLLPGKSKYVLVPIAYPRRDGLIDTLSIEQSDSVRAYTLGRADTIGVTIALLLLLAEKADITEVPNSDLAALCYSIPTADAMVTAKSVDQVVAALGKSEGRYDPSSLTFHGWTRVFIKALSLFRTRRLLLVPCIVNGPYLKLVYQFEVAQDELRQYGIRESVRRLGGRLPDSILVDLPLISRSQSYHFRLRAPEQHFVREAKLYRGRAESSARAGKLRRWELAGANYSRATVRGTQPEASGLCHIYVADLPREGVPDARHFLHVRVAQLPPSQLSGAMLQMCVAVAIAIATWRFGPRLVVAQPSGLLSFFAALPTLLGASFFLGGPRKATRGPLLARVAALASGALAVATSALLLAWMALADEARKNAKAEFAAPDSIWMPLLAVVTIGAIGAVWCLSAAVRNWARYNRARSALLERRRDIHFN